MHTRYTGSKYWGKDGYIWMARGQKNDCGVTTDPVVAIVEQDRARLATLLELPLSS